MNDYFKENSEIKKALLIAGGGLSDILVVGMLGYWALYGRSWRMPTSLVCLYIMRHITSVSPIALINDSRFDIVYVEDKISS